MFVDIVLGNNFCFQFFFFKNYVHLSITVLGYNLPYITELLRYDACLKQTSGQIRVELIYVLILTSVPK